MNYSLMFYSGSNNKSTNMKGLVLRMKKVLSTLLCASMLIGSCPAVLADETTTENNSVWNYNLIERGSECLYQEFPFSINKLMQRDMGMGLYFLYLKNLGANDSVEVQIVDTANNSTVLSKTLTGNDNAINFDNVPNNKTYQITVNETINNIANQYGGYIKTSFVEADFPANITLGDNVINNNSGEVFSKIAYKKVGEKPECNHESEDECTAECSMSAYIHTVTASELDTFYNTLDDNAYYELQMTAIRGTSQDTYRGFISTHDGGENEGIFTPGFVFTQSLDVCNEAEPLSRPMPMATSIRGDDYFPTAVEYELYENVYLDFSEENYYVFKYTAQETGYYAFETIGNMDLQFDIYKENDGVLESLRPNNVKSGGEGSNPRASYGWLVDEEYKAPVYYIEITEQTETTDTMAAFRVVRTDSDLQDDYTNNRDEVQTACDAGNYSNKDIVNGYIDYSRDVDVFGYDFDSGNGYWVFTSTATNIIVMDNYVYERDTSGFDLCWLDADQIAQTGTEIEPHFVEFSDGRHYIEVKQLKRTLPAYGDESAGFYEPFECNYNFSVYDPRRPDPLDVVANPTYGNTSPVYPTLLTSLNKTVNGRLTTYTTGEYGSSNEIRVTLHKGDTDMYTFTTGNNVSDFTATVKQYESGHLPTLQLYDSDTVEILSAENESPSWRMGTALTVTETTTDENEEIQRIITYDNLKKNHQYYLRVSRASSTAYNSYYNYGLTVVLEENVPAAVLSQNVELSHTYGENITSVDSYLTAVMNSMTCSVNGIEISDSEALENVKLYYNNAELTADVVNSLQTGTYTIVPKYNDVSATGGTVTLTVSPAAAVPSAVIESAVTLSHTNGSDITSTDAFKSTIMSNMTCKINDVAVDDSEAISDVELYYNDSVLTASVVNSLGAGTYPIVVKYQDVVATGGIVTLTVSQAASDNKAEIEPIENEGVILETLDWLWAAKLIANIRLRREGSQLNTMDIPSAAIEFGWEDPTVRGELLDTKNAAVYFYTFGEKTTGANFLNTTITESTAENTLFNSIKSGKAVIIQLTSTLAPTDMSLARYLVLVGVDKDLHTVDVMDPYTVTTQTVSINVLFDGGYGGDNNLRFTGRIIEYV